MYYGNQSISQLSWCFIFRSNTNDLFFHVASKTQKNDQCINERASENTETVTEREIEQLIYHNMQYFTPPQKDDLIHKMTYL